MEPGEVAKQPSKTEAEVRRIRALLEGARFDAALQATQAQLLEVPENRDLLYMMAVAQRYLRQVPEALATLAKLEKLRPGYARLYQEMGQCHVARRDAERAIAAFQQAVGMNPTLVASWNALAALYRLSGRQADADNALAHIEKIRALPPEVVAATSLFGDGELALAEEMIRQYLMGHPTDIEAMRLLARIGMKSDVIDDAEFLLDSVLLLSPDYHAARFDFVEVLIRRQNHLRALAELKKLLSHEPENLTFKTLEAFATSGLGDHEAALVKLHDLIQRSPDDPELHVAQGHALKAMGRTAEAIAAYRQAATVRPQHGDAWWSLANLKLYRFTDEEIERTKALEADPDTSVFNRFHLCFALGKGLEDRGSYAESFQYYARGNGIKRELSQYDAQAMTRNLRAVATACTRELMEARAGAGWGEPGPILIVGLPRAGSTLLEQILSSHPQVEGTTELANVQRIVNQLIGHDFSNPRYPKGLGELSAQQLQDLGKTYLADAAAYRTGKPFFIDKNPNNFRHLGLVHLMLPNAKIIDARRGAMACCFGNFKQLFASGQEFSYSLDDLAQYYRAYIELMDHWDTVMPGKVLRVRHEEVVEDLEGSVRRILDFLGLEFHEACLDFHKSSRSVRTPSSEQVRQPIYREGMNQWRHYEPWLEPLRSALGPLAEA
jgi:tetratricopeptide (TPR) repeat protein